MDIRKDNEAVALGPSFPEIPCPLLIALLRCFVKKGMYHSRSTFKEALKQSYVFQKKQKL